MQLFRGVTALTFLTLAPSLAGCASFSAPIDRTVARGQVTARLEKASGHNDKDPRVALVVERVPEGLLLLQASLRADMEPVCGGVQATKFSRSAATSAREPLRNGERIVLEFDSAALAPLFGPGPRLDLLVQSAKGTRRCIPLELTEGRTKLEFEHDERFTLGGDLGIERYTSELGPVSYLAAFVGTFGVWIDRYHLELGAGIGGAGCHEPYCEPDPESETNESTIFPFHLGVLTPLYETGEFSLGLGARYRVVNLRADTRTGEQSFWAHGPVLSPYVAAVLPVQSEAVGGARLGFGGIELPVGYAMADNGEQSWSVGVNLRLFFTAFF